MDVLIHVIDFIIAIIATVGFAIVFSAPKKELIFCGLNGAIGFTLYSLLLYFGLSAVISTFIATLAVQFLSRLFAVKRHTPITVYLITGLFPLFPGSGLYYTAYYLLTKNPDASDKALETFALTGAIVLGIVIGAVLSESIIKGKRKSKLKEATK